MLLGRLNWSAVSLTCKKVIKMSLTASYTLVRLKSRGETMALNDDLIKKAYHEF